MMRHSVLIVLLATVNISVAQRGYNYQPPPGGLGDTPIRPGYPSRPGSQSDTPTAPAFPSPVGGYPTGPATQPPFAGYPPAGFPSRPGSQADVPTGPGGFPSPGGFPGTGTSSGTRPNIPSRPGVFPGSRPGAGGVGGGQFPSGGSGIGTGFGGGSGNNNIDGTFDGGDYSAIPGQPGADYPIYTEIPQTSFNCLQQQYPGYYADVEAQCQVFHVCSMNKTYDFLCPNGTIFSQETLVCVWWNQFDCASAPALYPNNAFIYDYTQTGQNSQQQSGIGGGNFPVGTPRPPSTGFQQRPSGPGFSGVGGRPTGPAGGYPSAGYPGLQGPTGSGVVGGGGGGFPSTGTPSGSGFTGGSTPAGSGFSNRPTGGPGSSFPSAPSGPGFGTTIQPGFPPVQGDATIAPISPNREYLPPRRT